MKNKGLMLAAVALSSVLIGAAGCGKEEEKVPAGYYTGPMQPKSSTTTTDSNPQSAPTTNNPKQGVR